MIRSRAQGFPQTAGIPRIRDHRQPAAVRFRRAQVPQLLEPAQQIGCLRNTCGARRELHLHGVGRDAERDSLLLDTAVAAPRGGGQAVV